VLALGLGVPVVGTAVDGLARTLAAGRGVLVPPEDPPSLAAALSRVLSGERPDPGPGRVYAHRFTPGAAAAVYAAAYRQLLAHRSNRGRASVAPPSNRRPISSAPHKTERRAGQAATSGSFEAPAKAAQPV